MATRAVPDARAPRGGQLPSELFDIVFAGHSIEHWQDGEELFLQDDPPDRVFGIVSGAVEISLYSPDGRKIVANMEAPRSLVGEVGAIDGGPRTATATCVGPCQIYSVSRSQFLERVTNSPQLSAAMIGLLCARIRWINAEFGDQVMLKVDARLAKRLLFLSSAFASEEGWVSISQAELADFLGATRESVNKNLKQWRQARIIDIRRGGIRILDEARLRGNAAARQPGDRAQS
jgi:CRP-like cAMP-binding protein